MATTITNRANLRYTYGAVTETVASNLASTVLDDPLSVTKSSLEAAYRDGEPITYIITVTNGSTATLSNVTITDDLGTYAPSAGVEATPLTYVGPAQLFSDGVFSEELTPVIASDSVTFTIPEIAPDTTATILYKAEPNAYAPVVAGSEITNTASFVPAVGTEPITASHTIPAEEYAAVTIEKEMTPNPITDGAALVNTFTITNTGNTEATDLVLTDAFMMPLSNVVITVNGVTVPSSDYAFAGNTLTLPTPSAQTELTVPATTYTQDPATGAVTSVPGVTTVVVTGTI